MARTIEVAPGVEFSADVLALDWIFTASGRPKPEPESATHAKRSGNGVSAASSGFSGSHPISVLEQIDLL
jgi:hypothetical protein